MKKLLVLLCLTSAVGVLCGATSAAFLALLDVATERRLSHPAIIYALPLAGFAMGGFYARYGTRIAAGNTLVIETLRAGGERIPLRMAPMVLFGTVLTHLFGGSAGREGTAVQMGASIADEVAHRTGDKDTRAQLIAAGMAGGFGAVFGTPLAGAVFALELLVAGRVRALLPALVAAFVGDRTTHLVGIVHTQYPQLAPVEFNLGLALKWALFAAAIAAATLLFIHFLHACKRHLGRIPLPWRMAMGGTIVVVLWRLCGNGDALGLSIPTLLRAFSDPALPPLMWLAKLTFTAITVGAGFVGGEVTPLFVVGGTLGNTLAEWLDLPLALAAGVGMAAAFASAAKAPLALSIMAVELMGIHTLPHVLLVCVLANLLVGRRTIYVEKRTLGGPIVQRGSAQ